MSEDGTTEHDGDDPEPQVEPAPDELADEAAEEAEPPAEPEHESEPQGVTPEAWEKRFQKAEKRFETYRRAVADIWEEDALHLQPFSLSPSAPPGFIDVRDAGRVPDDVKDATLQFLGFAREQDYEADPETRECATCKGKGKTKTGSHVAGKETRSCPTCLGSGAQGLGVGTVTAGTNGGGAEPFTLAAVSSSDAPDADNWREPRILPDGRENPNYGKMPQFKVQVEPWGVTAGLGAQDAVA